MIGKARALVGGLLGIKPILGVVDGEVVPVIGANVGPGVVGVCLSIPTMMSCSGLRRRILLEESAQVGRLRYLLAYGVKKGSSPMPATGRGSKFPVTAEALGPSVIGRIAPVYKTAAGAQPNSPW